MSCVSLNDVYNSHKKNRKEIKMFCDSVIKDYEIKSSHGKADCVIQASLVERSNRYEELYYWFLGASFATQLLIIPVLFLPILTGTSQ